jgi:hypothetical protein
LRYELSGAAWPTAKFQFAICGKKRSGLTTRMRASSRAYLSTIWPVSSFEWLLQMTYSNAPYVCARTLSMHSAM